MKKFFLMFAFLSILAGTAKVSAQEGLDPYTDYLYTSANTNAYLKFDINDQLQRVFFSSGKIWCEYEIKEDNYLGDGKGWVYKVIDGFGNEYTIKRPSLEGNISVSPVKGKVLNFTRKKY